MFNNKLLNSRNKFHLIVALTVTATLLAFQLTWGQISETDSDKTNSINKKCYFIKDGTCSAWADFFVSMLKAQGITGNKVDVFVTLDEETYPNVFDDPTAVALEHYLMMPEGVGKHHGQNPRERAWKGHTIVVYSGKYTTLLMVPYTAIQLK